MSGLDKNGGVYIFVLFHVIAELMALQVPRGLNMDFNSYPGTAPLFNPLTTLSKDF
jgi:hypothetical protein